MLLARAKPTFWGSRIIWTPRSHRSARCSESSLLPLSTTMM
jgi:hypothetical protein